jgi:hypothetical protein
MACLINHKSETGGRHAAIATAHTCLPSLVTSTTDTCECLQMYQRRYMFVGLMQQEYRVGIAFSCSRKKMVAKVDASEDSIGFVHDQGAAKVHA